MIEREGVIDWLLASDEPWTRYRTRLDLLGESSESPAVLAEKHEMLKHPKVLGLIESMKRWGEEPFTRHNDANYPVYKLALLADFGFDLTDAGIDDLCQAVMSHQSGEGAFQCLISIPRAFGGDGLNHWTWIICDAPTLLGALLAFGYQDDPRVKRSLAHLLSLVDTNGFRCVADWSLGKFRGPGKKEDPCPIANLLALKAFSRVPDVLEVPAVARAAEMLLAHWASEAGRKYYMFGVGTTFRKLKAPLIWYDLLNVCDTLSRFPVLRADARLRSMAGEIFKMADHEGRFTATSMYKSWVGWSFADKKQPSPWLTFLVRRIAARMEN